MITQQDILEQLQALDAERAARQLDLARIEGAEMLCRHQLKKIAEREQAAAEGTSLPRLAPQGEADGAGDRPA